MIDQAEFSCQDAASPLPDPQRSTAHAAGVATLSPAAIHAAATVNLLLPPHPPSVPISHACVPLLLRNWLAPPPHPSASRQVQLSSRMNLG